MELKQYLSRLATEDRSLFAKQCGTSIGHLQNVAYGIRRASTELAVSIERESGGCVTRVEMFPDTFAARWPELAKCEPNTAQTPAHIAQAATETVAQGVA